MKITNDEYHYSNEVGIVGMDTRLLNVQPLTTETTMLELVGSDFPVDVDGHCYFGVGTNSLFDQTTYKKLLTSLVIIDTTTARCSTPQMNSFVPQNWTLSLMFDDRRFYSVTFNFL